MATNGMSSAMGMGMNAGTNAEVGAADLDIELPSPMEPRPEAERFRRSFPEKCVDDYSLLTAWALPGTEHPGLKGPRQMVLSPEGPRPMLLGRRREDMDSFWHFYPESCFNLLCFWPMVSSIGHTDIVCCTRGLQ